MPHFHNWLQHHRLLTFFVLSYAISWLSWPVYAMGLMPQTEFLPIGPLAAALIVIGLAEGRAGYRAWGRRIIPRPHRIIRPTGLMEIPPP